MGLFDGRFNGQQLLYYTILSNLVIAVSFSALLYQSFRISKRKNTLHLSQFTPNLRGGLVAMIVTTGLVYHLILVPFVPAIEQYGLHKFSNFLVHTFVPLAVFIDWLWGGAVNKKYLLKPYTWLVIPLGYYLLAVGYASFNIPLFQTGSPYAYFFIDSTQLGWGRALGNVLLFGLFFLALGYGLKGLKASPLFLSTKGRRTRNKNRN